VNYAVALAAPAKMIMFTVVALTSKKCDRKAKDAVEWEYCPPALSKRGGDAFS